MKNSWALRELAVFAFAALTLFCSLSVVAGPLATQASEPGVPEQLRDVGITEHLGDEVGIATLTFKDEKGTPRRLGEYFQNGRPVLLALVYFECPNLCTFVLNGLVDGLKGLQWTPGREFEVVAVSIDPKEDAKLAEEKKAAYLQAYGREGSASGWHFLTGDDSQIKKLAAQVGFGYKYDAAEKQYAHSAALFVLTPAGKISRYLYGIQYRHQDLKMALLEASSGKIGTVVDRFLLFCFRYDPKSRRYSFYLTRLMQAGAGGTVIGFGGYLGYFWLRQGSRKRRRTRS